MIWLSLAFNYAGLSVFVLAMESHRGTGLPQAPAHRRPLLRVAGALLQILALLAATFGTGIAIGIVEWIVGWAVCGFILSLVLALARRVWLAPFFLFGAVSIASFCF